MNFTKKLNLDIGYHLLISVIINFIYDFHLSRQ